MSFKELIGNEKIKENLIKILNNNSEIASASAHIAKINANSIIK